MFDRSALKKQAKAQLKGRYGTALVAALIIVAITSILKMTEASLALNEGFIKTLFTIVQFCINSVLGYAYAYLCMRIATSNDNIAFSDFTDGLTLIKPAILGNLWFSLWIFLWVLLCIIPATILILILIAITSVQLLDFSNLESMNFSYFETFTSFEEFWQKMISGYLWLGLIMMAVVIAVVIILIAKSLQYSMMPFVLVEGKQRSVRKAMRISIELTKGHKGDIFVLGLSFLGWLILSAVPYIILSRILSSVGKEPDRQLLQGITSLTASFVIPYITTSYVNAYHSIKQDAIAIGRIKEEDFNN